MSNATLAYRQYQELERAYETSFDLANLNTVGTLRPMSALERAGQMIAERGHVNAMLQFVIKANMGHELSPFDVQVALAIDEDARR